MDHPSACSTSARTIETVLSYLAECIRAQGVAADDVDGLCRLGHQCMNHFDASPLLMREVIWRGAKQKLFVRKVIEHWQDSCVDFLRPSAPIQPLDSAIPQQRVPLAGRATTLADYQIPEPLRSHEQAIQRHARGESRGVVHQGGALLAAKQCCAQQQLNFEQFLLYLKERYGLHRATAYTYMKCAEWNLPESLGFGIMKWIVQGGNCDLAAEIVRDVQAHTKTLSELKARYGARRAELRSRRSAAGAGPAPAPGPGKRSLLLTERERLVAERARLDLQIAKVEQQLRQMLSDEGGNQAN